MSQTTRTTSSHMANWKNVNNWHWTEKNCTLWSQEYLTKEFKTIQASNQEIKVKIKSVDKIDGDVDINQRKGKVLYFYDLKVKLSWQAESIDASLTGSGTLNIPEFSHEISNPSELSFQVEVQEESNKHAILRENLAKVLREPIFKLLEQFQTDLEKVHGPTVIVDAQPPPASLFKKEAEAGVGVGSETGNAIKQNTLSNPSKSVATTTTSTAATTTTTTPSPSTFSTCTLRQTIEFSALPSDIYALLVDPAAMQVWTRGSVKISPASTSPPLSKLELNTEFQLFDGNVICSFIEQDPEHHKLRMQWRFKTWPAGHVSIVNLALSKRGGGGGGAGATTQLVLTQTQVPSADLERTEHNWKEYYWNSMKRIYGYGSIDTKPSSSSSS